MKKWASILIACALVSACFSGSKEVSKGNFKRVIAAYLAQAQGVCLDPPRGKAPFATPVDMSFYPLDEQRAEALVAAGLVERRQVTLTDLLNKPMPGYEYTLTPAGKASYRIVNEAAGRGAFCAGKHQIEEVLSFSEPADFLGKRVSEVRYHRTLVDAPAWAKLPAVVAAFPHLRQEFQETASTVLELNGDGWVDGRAGMPK